MIHIITVFIKIGSEENIRDLYENGTIYINTIDYFKNIEDEELRGDKYEGVSEIINSHNGTFWISGIDRDFKYKKVHIKKAFDEIVGNIYSLFCVSSKTFSDIFEIKVDEKNLKFGTHCLIVKDNKYFFDKITSELEKKGYNFRHGFVEYYDKDNVCKKLTLFDKPKEFEYQKEFRFYIYNNKIEPIKIQIGSLKGIAEIIESKYLKELKIEIRQKKN